MLLDFFVSRELERMSRITMSGRMMSEEYNVSKKAAGGGKPSWEESSDVERAAEPPARTARDSTGERRAELPDSAACGDRILKGATGLACSSLAGSRSG